MDVLCVEGIPRPRLSGCFWLGQGSGFGQQTLVELLADPMAAEVPFHPLRVCTAGVFIV